MTDFGALSEINTVKYGKTFAQLFSVDSTNNYIRRLSPILPDGFAAFAQEQLAGRGRQGKSFYSPSGGLYFSVLFKSPKTVSDGLFTAKISLAVCRAIDRLTGTDASNGVGIKWVNDIYFGSKKLCGILCERLKDENGKPYVIAGIGVNLTLDYGELPRELRSTVCSLFDITKKHYGALELASLILGELEPLLDGNISDEDFIREYSARSIVIGHEITVLRGDEKIRAAALEICTDGSLLVRYEDGFTAKLCGGEISIRVKE